MIADDFGTAHNGYVRAHVDASHLDIGMVWRSRLHEYAGLPVAARPAHAAGRGDEESLAQLPHPPGEVIELLPTGTRTKD
jgi:hypothetical protein